MGTDGKPYDNNGKCLTEGGLFPLYQREDGKRAKKPEATRVTIIKQDNKPGPKPKDTKNTAQSDLDTTQEAMDEEADGNTVDRDTAGNTVGITAQFWTNPEEAAGDTANTANMVGTPENSGDSGAVTSNSGITVIEPASSTSEDQQQM